MTRSTPSRTAAGRGVAFSASPVLAVKLPAWRSRLVLFFLFIAFGALAARAFWLQAISTDFLQKQGESRYARTLEVPATRGKIMDRNGEVMATSLPVRAIEASPDDVQASKEQLQEFATLLGIGYGDLKKKLDSDRNFVYLKRQVDPELAKRILDLNIPGIRTSKEYKRSYPAGPAAAHLLGFTDYQDVGKEGIEYIQQKSLAGVTGSRRVIRDRQGRVVEDVEHLREPRDGKDLTLSIDNKIQYLAYTQLQQAVDKFNAKAGAIVVLDVKTGEVLAMVNMPTFNPNNRQGVDPSVMRNRVMTDTFEPGSTMKPFTIARALDKGLITPDTVIDTPPKLTMGPATIGDSHPHASSMTVTNIIGQSSNVGTVKIAQKLESHDMWDIFTAAGFGQQPRFGFPGAVAGRMKPYKSWRPIEQATISYGQGISVSLIQLARAYMMFARNGEMIPLRFQKLDRPPVAQRVLSERAARQMRLMMEKVVSSEGTAPFAQVRGYRIAGKTGTAYKVEGGQYVKKYVGSFVGLAPVSDPRIIIAVMIDEPTGPQHFGGQVAAPAFSNVAAGTLRLLNVAPDAPITNVILPAAPLTETM